MKLAPVVLFTYNRPRHTKLAIEALQKNELADSSDIIIFSDGPKTKDDIESVRAIRQYLKSIEGFRSVNILERNDNLGLAPSVISGVTEIVNSYGRIIVLEDDMVTSQYFLRFMNDALEYYETEEMVISIHGYVYPLDGLPETFFLKGADCWGWATWQRGWNLFEADGEKLLFNLKSRGVTHQFDFEGAYDYTKMLEAQVRKEISSWAIRWYASAFLADKLTLYPGKSLIFNTGIDGSGTHCGASSIFDTEISTEPIKIGVLPIQENSEVRKIFHDYLSSVKPTIASRIATSIKKNWELGLNQKLIGAANNLIPPVITKALRKLINPGMFSGNYKSWDEARSVSGGFESDLILTKVKNALLKVKSGEAVYERDSVLFDRIQYSWPLLSGLLWVASRCGNKLNLVDFGGALGSTYFQNKRFLEHLLEIKWNIVEQENFVECGKFYFEDGCLRFYRNLGECITDQVPDVIILSSILQYLEKPYDLLAEIFRYDFRYILVDRTPFLEGEEDRITIQKVPPAIYPASYPAWFFNQEKFLGFFPREYELFADFDSFESFQLGGVATQNKGFIFIKGR
jgi:putative methyltransferase (TIGR04325 family)